MENFFKQFRHNWHNRPDMPLAEADWLALHKKLEGSHKKRQSYPGIAWLTIPCCLLLSGLNIHFFNSLKDAGKRISRLEMLKDTIILTRVIYQTDTIWQTSIFHKATEDHFIPTYIPRDTKSWIFDNKKQYIEDTNEVQIPYVIPKMQDVKYNATECLALNNRNVYLQQEQPLMKMDWIIEPAKQGNTLRRFLNNTRPKNFSIAASAGLVYPNEPGVHALYGWSTGLSAAIEFPKNIRLWSAVTQLNVNFTSEKMGESFGVPQIASPAPEFVFKEADWAQSTWQFSAGIDRYFPIKNRKLQPLIGLGYAAVRWQPYEVSYDFIRKNDNVEWSIVKEVELKQWIHDFGIFRVGMDYKLSKKWNAEIIGTYRVHFRQTEKRMSSLPGFQFGLRCFL